MSQQQLIAEITWIAEIVTKLKGEKNDAQVKYDEIIKNFNNFTKNIQDALSEVFNNMNIDQASKDKILKNIKDKIDEIIEKILGVNDYTYPDINDEYDEIRDITV